MRKESELLKQNVIYEFSLLRRDDYLYAAYITLSVLSCGLFFLFSTWIDNFDLYLHRATPDITRSVPVSLDCTVKHKTIPVSLISLNKICNAGIVPASLNCTSTTGTVPLPYQYTNPETPDCPMSQDAPHSTRSVSCRTR